MHGCLWTVTMIEAWAWGRGESGLVADRAESPRHAGSRWPSHAGERRELQAGEIQDALRVGLTEPEIRATAERLLDLAA